MQTSAAIEARDLTKTYGGGVRALDGLGFTVQAGTVFGLLGPNGAGKSTTVRILTTLSRPDGGQASVAGIDVLAHPERVRRAIGLVAQRSGVDLEATGRENLTLQGQVYGLRGAELRRRVGELLERFGLAEAADRVPGVWEVTIEGRSLRARTDDGSAAVPAVLQALEAGGVRVASVTIARPSLDDVYLRHTGRSLARTEETV